MEQGVIDSIYKYEKLLCIKPEKTDKLRENIDIFIIRPQY